MKALGSPLKASSCWSGLVSSRSGVPYRGFGRRVGDQVLGGRARDEDPAVEVGLGDRQRTVVVLQEHAAFLGLALYHGFVARLSAQVGGRGGRRSGAVW